MQDQLEIVKEIISSFLKDSREGKKQLVEWFLNSVMEEEARIQVSSLASELDQRVKSFLERPIEKPMKFIYIDGTYFKIREDGRYRNKAMYL